MDYNEIFKQVEEVIRYSQDFPDDMPCNLSNLKNYWGTGKAPWIELFDKHLIYEYPEPVSFSVSNEAKLQMFNGFINMPIFDDYPDLQNFIEDIQSTEFFNNHLEANYEFYDADIVYGDTLSFEGDILRTNFMDSVGRGKRKFDCL